MDRRHTGAWLAALALLAGGCARAPAPEPFAQATADAAAERFAAHDAAAVASFHTVDAPAVEFATVEAFVFGDHAWRQGSFRIEDAGKATPATEPVTTDAADDEPA